MSKLTTAIRLLRDLSDLQNGPPLEQHRTEWEQTMHEVATFLNENDQSVETNPDEILAKHLKQCYETHGVTLPDKYHGYILRAMREYGGR